MSTFIENGEIKKWYRDLEQSVGLDPKTEMQKMIDAGLLELHGHECSHCGRTWVDENDDTLTLCINNEGCSAFNPYA